MTGGYGGPNPIGGAGPEPVGPPSGYPNPSAPPLYPAPQPPPSMPGGPPPSMPGGPPPWQFGPPPQRNRKPLIITLLAGGAVVVVAIIIGVIALAGGGGKGPALSAGETMQRYLEALARGDAEAALSYSDDQPGSKELLTDDILKQQIDHMPITNIKILGDSAVDQAGVASVHVSANFGDKVSDVTVAMKKNGRDWKLETAAVKLGNEASTHLAALKTLTLFGKNVGDGVAYVFPGWMDVGTNNPNLTVTSGDPILLNGLTRAVSAMLSPKFDMNDAGRQAVLDAAHAAIAKCAESHELAPAGCPQKVADADAVDGTVDWGQPDLSTLKVVMFNQFDMTAPFVGTTSWPLTAQSPGGGQASGSVLTMLTGKADLTQNPPAISFGLRS